MKKGLKNHDSWLNLINLYEGNPVYLKSIAILIKNIFDGDVIVLKLSQFEQPLSRETLRESLELSSTDLINGLQSLQQRYLVTKIKQDQIMFKLSSIFREYVRNFCQD